MAAVDPNNKRNTWTPEEDKILATLVSQYGPKKWGAIADHLPARNAKQCHQRYVQVRDKDMSCWRRAACSSHVGLVSCGPVPSLHDPLQVALRPEAHHLAQHVDREGRLHHLLLSAPSGEQMVAHRQVPAWPVREPSPPYTARSCIRDNEATHSNCERCSMLQDGLCGPQPPQLPGQELDPWGASQAACRELRLRARADLRRPPGQRFPASPGGTRDCHKPG